MIPKTASVCELQFRTVRGFTYRIESATTPMGDYTEWLPEVRAENTILRLETPITDASRFFRALRMP